MPEGASAGGAPSGGASVEGASAGGVSAEGAPSGGASAEGTSTEAASAELPETLRPLQQAGWWTLFGAFAVGTVAGVFGGLAERQEDRVIRLAYTTDIDGARPLYADVQEPYERHIARGIAYERTAIGLAATTGALAIAAVTLFIVDHRRARKQRLAGMRNGSLLEVRF